MQRPFVPRILVIINILFCDFWVQIQQRIHICIVSLRCQLLCAAERLHRWRRQRGWYTSGVPVVWESSRGNFSEMHKQLKKYRFFHVLTNQINTKISNLSSCVFVQVFCMAYCDNNDNCVGFNKIQGETKCRFTIMSVMKTYSFNTHLRGCWVTDATMTHRMHFHIWTQCEQVREHGMWTVRNAEYFIRTKLVIYAFQTRIKWTLLFFWNFFFSFVRCNSLQKKKLKCTDILGCQPIQVPPT